MNEHCKSKQVIGHAIRKHGKENFTFQKLLWFDADADAEAEAKDNEKFLISEMNTLAPRGYNEAEGGCGGDTMAGSDEKKRDRRCKRISEKAITRYKNMTTEEIRRMSERAKVAHENMTTEARTLMKKRMSENHADFSGSKHPQYIHFTQEQETFIREQKKIGIPICKIPQYFFEKFDIKIGHGPISRVLKNK